MSYDDPTLKEFAGYFEAKEPGRRERADAWATAIGLQKVDGLSTSRFLVETAKEHIEGRITQAQARRRIRDYYAWYFRNALVRANYADYEQGVKRDWGYLEQFFRNLLLNETHELKSRYLLIGLTAGDLRELKTASDRAQKAGQKKAIGKGGQKRWSEKGGQKTRNRLIELLTTNPHLTREGLSAALGICPSAVQKHLAKLKKDNRIRRIGPDKGGHWEVVFP